MSAIITKVQGAIRRNDLNDLRKIIQNQPDEGVQLLSGTTYAIEHGLVEEIEPFFPSKGLTLMHVAAFYDSFEIFLFLIYRGFSTEVKSADDYQPIHYAALGGSREVLTYLCAEKSPSITQPSKVTYNVAYLATAAKSPELLTYLLEAGAQVIEQGGTAGNPIRRAIDGRNSACLTILLNHVSRIGSFADFKSFTPLMKAIAKGCFDAVPILLDYGANPNFVTSEGKSALSLACCFSGNAEIVRMLIDAGADVTHIGFNGQGPVHWAATSSNTEILRIVLEAGANPFIVDDKGNYAMSSVLCSPIPTWYEKFEILLNLELPINYRAKNGQLLLAGILVRKEVPPDVIRLLLEKGADLSLEARPGKSLLDIAKACAPKSTKDVIEKFVKRQRESE